MTDKGYDITVIGGGVVGCAIARELSKYKAQVLLLEKECDVAMGTSDRNSGVSHAGFYVNTGTLKAEMNVKGHEAMPKLCRDLGVPHQEVGKLVVAKDDDEREYLYKLKETGEKNGSKKLRIVDREEIKRLEPNIEGIEALHSPTSAILDPFILTIALAENAMKNGADIRLNTEVLGIEEMRGSGFSLKTNNGDYKSDIVINSAGLYSDKVASMVGIDCYRIHPCRGEYHILDKSKRHLINGAVYPVPPKELGGLGIHLTPTTDGNLMLGPSAEYIDEPDDNATTSEVMDQLYLESMEFLPKISRKDIIKSFSGVRPKLIKAGSKDPADFVIEESKKVPGFINLIGIESPGLTGAPAIAQKVAGIAGEIMTLEKNTSFDPCRKPAVRFNELSNMEKLELIKKEPDYGLVVCRCQTITKKEIMDALDNPIGARSISSVSRRCRATLGRCQGGFCTPKIVEIMEEKYALKFDGINLTGKGSELFSGKRGKGK